MGQVTVSHPVNGQPVDGNTMRAQLEALAAGINSVDGTQLADGSVSEDTINDAEVSLGKLKAGQFVHYGIIVDDDGSAYSGTYLDFDGDAGSNHGSLFKDNTWAPVESTDFQFRTPDGDDFVITPPQDCTVLLTGVMRIAFDVADGETLNYLSVAFWDENQGVVTDVNNHMFETISYERTGENSGITFINILGMAQLTGGVSYKLTPAIKLETTGSTGENSKYVYVYDDPKYAWIGAILLPR